MEWIDICAICQDKTRNEMQIPCQQVKHTDSSFFIKENKT